MITLWNKDASNTAQIEYMSERLQELLMTRDEVRYQDHKGTMKNNELKRKVKLEQAALPKEKDATIGPTEEKKKEKKPKPAEQPAPLPGTHPDCSYPV